MPDLTSWLRAGAIVPFSAQLPKSERCGEVVAGNYQHAALQGRPIVRLSVAEVADGVDAEMDALGFSRSGRVSQLGRQKFRALGFPGWALVHDPKRSRFALEVTRDFKKAKKRVRSKPGHARDAFVAIAERLGRSVPHFLPSFWEEAGRAFLEEDSAMYAAQCFEKARLVEKEHKLAIDEDVRSAVYLEFALSGAVAAKSLAGYAKELEKGYGAKVAYERYRELGLRRTLGGLPPWTGMGKELRALAKAASLDTDAEEARFLTEVLESPSMTRAPGDFWQLYRPALVALAQGDQAGVRSRLIQLLPEPNARADEFKDLWLELLEEAGVIDWLLEPPAPPQAAGVAATWLSAAIGYSENQALLKRYLERFRDRLVADRVPLDLAPGTGWRGIDLSLLEHALSLGIPMAEPPRRRGISLGALDCDPVRVAAHPAFAELLVRAVAEEMGSARFEAAARGKPGFREARRRWLEQQLSLLENGGLVSTAAALTTLTQGSTAALFLEFPEAYQRLQRVQLGGALARTLRGGLFAELTWPIWEQAVSELGAGECQLGGFFPHPVLHNAVKAIAVGAHERLAEHDFVVPKGAKVVAVWWIDGQFLVVLQTPREPARAYWSAAPSNLFEFSRSLFNYGTDLGTAFPLPAGGLVTPNGTKHAGDKDPGSDSLLTDGQTFWTRGWHEGALKLREFDAKTGTVGRASWPSFVTPLAERSDDLKLRSVWLMPLPAGVTQSPLGQRDGLCGQAQRTSNDEKWEVTGVDGRSRSASYDMDALATWPGAVEARSLVANRFWSDRGTVFTLQLTAPDGLALGVSGQQPWTIGHGLPVPLACFHFLTPRDETGSKALRQTSDATAQALVGADEKAATRLVAQHFSEITAEPLRRAVVAAALASTQLQEGLTRLVLERAPERASDQLEAPLQDKELMAAAGLVTDERWSRNEWSPDVVSVGRFLAGNDVSSVEPSNLKWIHWLPRPRALAVLAVAPFISDAARGTLCTALSTLRRAKFFERPEQLRIAKIEFGKQLPALDQNKVWRTTVGVSRFDVRPQSHYHLAPESAGFMFERSGDGTFRVPPGVFITHEWRLPDRDDAAYLERFVELASATAAQPVDLSTADVVADITGLTRAESCLLWFGLATLHLQRNEQQVKDMLQAIELKTSEAKVAHETFAKVPEETWLELLDAAAPDDPAQLFDQQVLARRLAEGWVRLKGKRIALRAELLVTVEKELDPPVSSAALLEATLAPAASSLLQVHDQSLEDVFAWQQPTDRFAGPAVSAIAELIAWGFGALPVADPYRDALIGLHAVTLARLDDPKLRLSLGTRYGEPKELRAVFDALGGEVKRTDDEDSSSLISESELFTASLDVHVSHATFSTAFRPSKLSADDAFAWSLEQNNRSSLVSVTFLRSAACARLIARVQQTPVPAGGFENNPLQSAPAVVERARKKWQLSPDAAQLYLQLLALHEPTNKNLLLYNGWKPAQLKKAGAELLEKGLVVEGKRERAGRELFLPGPWEKSTKKSLPLETWKAEMYRLPRGEFSRTLPVCPAHELFERALGRLESGDVPRLEEV